jgi:phosphatidylserine/phosphatidylglycerophosphate/cardiolipin synthase-like enzyme
MMLKYFTPRRILACILLSFLILLTYCFYFKTEIKNNQLTKVKVLSSKDITIAPIIIQEIQNSSKFVYLAMYTLTHEDLTNALISAKLRGLDVKVLLDYNQSLIEQSKPQISKLKKYNIEIKIPLRTEGIMHMKLLVTDSVYASGSFNWTHSANTTNDEIIEIGHQGMIYDQYLNIFRKIWKKSN